MVIYLVVYKNNSTEDLGVISSLNKEKAISCISDIAANGYFESNLYDYIVSNSSLEKIIEFDVVENKGKKLEVVMENGRFELKKIRD